MQHVPQYKEMTTASRQAAFMYLHGRCNEGELGHGALAESARLFSVSHRAMALFWREMNKKIDDEYLDAEDVLANTLFFENNRNNRGRRHLWDRNELRVAVSNIAMAKRTTFRNMSKAVNVPKSTLHHLMHKEGLFHRHTSALQPHLTDDELAESHVYRAVKNKRHVKMVMFLCAQARPRWDEHANEMWDGKIGIWPIGQYEPAERTSVNRPAGTPVYVSLAYQQYDSTKINRIWLTLMAVLNKIIEHHGGNNFRLPHLKKGVLDVAGQLPNSLTVTAAALEYLDGHNYSE
jgi:hypothetical protein